MRLARKFNKIKNQEENYMEKPGGTPEKTSPKWANFRKNTPKLPLAVNWNSKRARKFEIKTLQNRNLQKTSPKNKQISIKQAQKQATRKSSKIPQLHKKQAQIR